MDLQDLFAERIDDAGVRYNDFMGLPGAGRVYDLVRSESHTEPLIATLFWQVLLASPAFPRFLSEAGASLLAASLGEPVLVAHRGQYDLAVFDPAFDDPEPRVVPVYPSPEELRAGWERWRRVRFGQVGGQPGGGMALVESVEWSLVEAAPQVQPFHLVVMRPPLLEKTAVPAPPWGVAPGVGAPATSTAGVVARERGGLQRTGVTVALHALTDALQAVVPGTSAVAIDGQWGTVLSVDPITDSAFVEIPGVAPPPVPWGSRGPLGGVSPRSHEKATFEGIASLRQEATVTGWSPDIPFVLPYSQLKVFTTACTARGDSGAALVDDSDCVLGFSFYRTGLGQPVEFSAWVWADSVYQAHGIQ